MVFFGTAPVAREEDETVAYRADEVDADDIVVEVEKFC